MKLLRIYIIIFSLLLIGAFSALVTDVSSKQKGMMHHQSLSTPEVDRMPENHAWIYDFSQLPNGPLPSEDWNFEVGNKAASYNKEAQTYTQRLSNVRIEDGVLVIEAKPEVLNNKNYSSARVHTKDKFGFQYGTIEVEMMLPAGVGTWPAAWLMPVKDKYSPNNYGVANNDPYGWAVNGEIDFGEAIGRLPYLNIPAAHSYNSRKFGKTVYTPARINDAYSKYHKYGVILEPGKITFTLDGMPYTSRTQTSNSPLDWPFDQSYYLILNLALGGDWAGADGIDNSSAPWQIKVKSIAFRPL